MAGPLHSPPPDSDPDPGAGGDHLPLCAGLAGDIVAWLDGELTPERAAELDAHLGRCAPCRQLVDSHRAVAAVLDEWARAPAPSAAPSAEELARAVRRSARAALPRRLALTALALAAAAALLVTLLPQLWRAPRAAETDPLLLENLDILVDLDCEAGDMGADVVEVLLDDVSGSIPLGPELFDEVLEEEIASENL